MAHRRGRTTIRAAALTSAVAIVLAACTPTPSQPAALPTASPAVPSVAATAAPPSIPPSPSPPAATPETVAQCEPADIKASHGRVEGAAGSRFTTVELVAAIGCSVDLFPAFGLRDANGAPLVSAAAGGAGRIDLVAGASYESIVRLANWCADDPAFPLAFELHVATQTEEVTGTTSFPEDGDVPPCNGEPVGRILESTSWEAVP